jgi:methyl-accepting chemotaxis protein
VNFGDLKIPHKLLAVFAVMLTAIAVMGVTLFVNQMEYEGSVERTERAYESLRAADTAAFRLTRQENSLRGFLLSGDEYYVKRLEEAHKPKFLAALEDLRTLAKGDQAQLARIADVDSRLRQLPQEGHRAGRDPGPRSGHPPAGVDLVKHDGVADKAVSAGRGRHRGDRQEFRSRRRHRGGRPEEVVAGNPPDPGDRHRRHHRHRRGRRAAADGRHRRSGVGHDGGHAPPGLGRQRRGHPRRRPQGRDRPDGRRRRDLQAGRDREDPHRRRRRRPDAPPPTAERAAVADEKAACRAHRRRRHRRLALEAWTAWPQGDLTHRIDALRRPKAESLKSNFNAAAERCRRR